MRTVTVFGVIALLLVWGAYPLTVRLLGSLVSPRGKPSGRSLPTVSLVLASAEGAGAIRTRVVDLLRTTYPAHLLEIIVALDTVRGSARVDELGDIDPRVTVLLGDAPGGKASSLNAAVRLARHELLVFADTAQRFDPEAILELVQSLDDPGVGAVSGLLELESGAGGMNPAEAYWRYERWLRQWEARLRSCVGVTGAIYGMRRALWTPLPTGLILDDVYIPMRLALAGWRIAFNSRAHAYDARHTDPRREYHRKVRTLTGNIQLVAWLPALLNPLANPLWPQFMCHKLLRLLTPYFAACVLVGGSWMALAAIVASPYGLMVGTLLLAIVGTLCAIERTRRILARQLAWGIALQSSVVVATANGLRGKWDVWQ